MMPHIWHKSSRHYQDQPANLGDILGAKLTVQKRTHEVV